MLQSVSRITVTEQHFLKGSGFSTLIVHNSQLGVHQTNGKLVLLNLIPLNEEVRFQWFTRLPITGTSVYCTAGCLVSISHYRIQQVFHFLTPHSESVQFQGTKMIHSRSSEMVKLPHPRASTGNDPKYMHTKIHVSGMSPTPQSLQQLKLSCSSVKENAGSLCLLLVTNVAPHWAPKSVTNYYFWSISLPTG